MNWDDLIGHDRLRQSLATSIAKGRLTGSILLVGPAGVGKTTVAKLLARTMLCQRVKPSAMAPCGSCPACVQVIAQTHPDLIEVRKPDDKSLIPIECLVGPVDARLREGFCHDLHLRPMQGNRKVAILHDADFLNEEGANCLLKTLEEPPSYALVILIGTNEQRQLPTIRSRCQVIRLASPTGDDAIALLRHQLRTESSADGTPVTATDAELRDAVEMAAGDMRLARRLATGDASQLRTTITSHLQAASPDPVALARVINGHLETAGKDAPKKREAMRECCAIAVQTYHQQLRRLATEGVFDPATQYRLDRSVRVFRELDRNANLATLVECYAADLAMSTTGDRGGIG